MTRHSHEPTFVRAKDEAHRSVRHDKELHNGLVAGSSPAGPSADGADKKLFADIVEKDFPPKSRAEICEREYARVHPIALPTGIGPGC